jgi:hypothetical protein
MTPPSVAPYLHVEATPHAKGDGSDFNPNHTRRWLDTAVVPHTKGPLRCLQHTKPIG